MVNYDFIRRARLLSSFITRALNGERAELDDDDSDNWENMSSDGSDTDR